MHQQLETEQSILFEFRKNGRIRMYSDENANGKINRRKDLLIGEDKYSKSFDKRYYGRDHFMSMETGDFEIEVEGWTNDKGQYEAFYSIRLDSGVDSDNGQGSFDINKFVDVKDHGLMTSLFQPDV